MISMRICNIFFLPTFFLCVFNETVSATNKEHTTEVYVASFSSEVAPSDVCGVLFNSSGSMSMGCSSFLMLSGDDSSKETKKYLLALPLASGNKEFIQGSTEVYLLLMMRGEETNEEFFPLQTVDRKNIFSATSANESQFSEIILKLEKEQKQLEENVQMVQSNLDKRQAGLLKTVEGQEYARLKKTNEELLLYQIQLEDFVTLSEKRMSSFMKNSARTSSEHKTIKNDLSSRIKKLVEMSLSK